MPGRRLALLIDASTGEHFPPYPTVPGDIERLKEVLGSPNIGRFNVVAVNPAEKETMEAALHRFFAESQVGDLLLFYFVGNLVVDRDSQFWFAALTTNPAQLEETAVSAEFVRAEMTAAAAGQFVVVLDARICAYEDNSIPWDQQLEVAGKAQALLAALAGPDFCISEQRPSRRLLPDFSITRLINAASVELLKNGNGFTVAELSLYLSTSIDSDASTFIARTDGSAGQIVFAPSDDEIEAEASTSTSGISSASSEIPGILPEENVQFTVYRPTTLAPGRWRRMLVFTHLDEAPHQSLEETTPAEEVTERAQRILADELENYRQLAADSQFPIPRESEITLVPDVPQITFNPPRRSFVWAADLRVHDESFLLRAPGELAGSLARGRLSIFLGHLLLADIPINFRVESPASSQPLSEPKWTQSSARPFRKVFASYSHHDAQIVEAMEHHIKALGYDYLRDVVHLRSGQAWDDRLLGMIKEADIFQLFWSSNSARSDHVEREWRYALALSRQAFVRPAFWEVPMPIPPQPLQGLHFYRLPMLVPVTGQNSSIRASETVAEAPGSYGTEVLPIPESAVPSKPLPPIASPPPPGRETKSQPQRKRLGVPAALLGGIVATCLVAFASFYGSKSWLSAQKAPSLSRENSSIATTPPLVLATPAAQTPAPALVGTTPYPVATPASPAPLASDTPRQTKKPSSEPKTRLEDSIAKPLPHYQ
jgi:hypothetical protein